MKRGELWWADLGPHRPEEQTGRRPVVVWQSDALSRLLRSVLVVPLTTNLDRGALAGTSLVEATGSGPAEPSVALAFQMRAVSKRRLTQKIRTLTPDEIAELETATDEALGRLEPAGS